MQLAPWQPASAFAGGTPERGRRLKSRPLDGILGAGATNAASDGSGHPFLEIAPEIRVCRAPAPATRFSAWLNEG